MKDWLREAYRLSEHSPDPRTKNAALLIDPAHPANAEIRCFNHMPRGLHKSGRWPETVKGPFVAHAEEAAIIEAAHQGICTNNKILVCPWAACETCARLIIGSGIRTMVVHRAAIERTHEAWTARVKLGWSMLQEARVMIVIEDAEIGDCTGFMDGEAWQP